MPRLLATHVGSLIRPPALIDYLREMEAGRPLDHGAYERCLTQSIADVVRQQAEAGIDIVSDGEFSKGRNWAFYIHGRLTGLERQPLTPEEGRNPKMLYAIGGRDREAFPEFYSEYDQATGMVARTSFRMVCVGPIAYTGHDEVQRDIANLKAATRNTNVVGAFLPVVAPASALPEISDRHYQDEESYLFALADALHHEYKAIADAGLMVQIDDAFLPYMHEKLVPPMTHAQYRRWAGMRIDALNHALRGIPEERSRYHICWGSWNGPHVFDVPLKDIIDLVLRVNVGHYSFEAANPRHEHEWAVWREAKLPAGKKLIPGVISHATNIVEHPELVSERIQRFAGIVGPDAVLGGTDCGFAQSPFARRVHPTIMWAKLKALAEGCRLAGKALSRRSTRTRSAPKKSARKTRRKPERARRRA